MKKVLSMILSLILVVSLFPMGAVNLIANAEMEWAYTYTVTGREATITEVDTELSGEITIPSKLGGYTVTRIGEYAFYDCKKITSIIIPDSVTTIDANAFCGCSGLTSITMPDTVTSIGANAFWICSNLLKVNISSIESWCRINFNNSHSNPAYYTGSLYLDNQKISTLTIPEGVTSISAYAFNNMDSITTVKTPSTLKIIGAYSFEDCSKLERMYISKSVEGIGVDAFRYCYDLKYVYYDGTSQEKNSIAYANGNNNFINASWYYVECLYSGGSHTYKDAFATKCSNCKYERIVYTIRYDYNMEDGSYNCQAKYVDKTVMLKSKSDVPTRDGYVFRGWSIYRIGESKYSGGENYSSNCDLTLYALWSKMSECNSCEGKGKITTTSTVSCSSCGGDGKHSSTSTRRTCTFCGGNVVKHVTGTIGTYYACQNCGGSSYTSSSSTSYYDCSSCSGTGKKTTSSTSTCNSCSGNGTTLSKQVSETPSAPTATNIKNRSIELETDGSYEFSLNGTDWKVDNIFDGLEPGTSYTVYRRVAETDTIAASNSSEALVVSTKSYILGDIDGVDGVTDADAEYLLMFTFFAEEYPVNQSCDFNGDGFVNDADAEHLLMFTFFPEEYPLH